MAKSPSPFRYNYAQSPPVDQVGIAERAARFTTRSIKAATKREGLDMVLNMIDLTTLEGADTPRKVQQLCYKAGHLHDSIPGLPTTAAVCVYSPFVKVARKALGNNSPIKIASVATGFPSGHMTLDNKLEETKLAVGDGADEVDMVISRGRFLSGDYEYVKVGMKPAGGISKSKLALHYLVMVKETVGPEWLTNEWFRFGASSLANDVLMQIAKIESGGDYQSPCYFSQD